MTTVLSPRRVDHGTRPLLSPVKSTFLLYHLQITVHELHMMRPWNNTSLVAGTLDQCFIFLDTKMCYFKLERMKNGEVLQTLNCKSL